MPFGLINRLKLTVANSDVDVSSPQAVSVQREASGQQHGCATGAVAGAGHLGGLEAAQPRCEDARSRCSTRRFRNSMCRGGRDRRARIMSPFGRRKGRSSELVLDVPTGATITDVMDGVVSNPQQQGKKGEHQSVVSLWRFDPDTRKLRVTLNPAQSRPFSVLVRSQVPRGRCRSSNRWDC